MSKIAKVMREVQADCERDAAKLDSTPFTPRGVGEVLGTTLAMIAAVARAVELLAEESGSQDPLQRRADEIAEADRAEDANLGYHNADL